MARTGECLMWYVTPPPGGAVTGSQRTSREVKSPSAHLSERPVTLLVFAWAVHYKQRKIVRNTQFSKEDAILTS